MKTKTRIIILTVAGVMLPFAGCYRPDDRPQTGWQLSGPTAQNAATQQPSAVESAIALSDKYAKLSEEDTALKQRNQALDTENKRLKDEMQTCRSQMEQLQKELSDANDLLVEMRLELNNWKNDILGFRDEMREAEKAQLEALMKILKLMGGEVKAETSESAQPSGTPVPENNQPSRKPK
jgi:chromosome segregation ATPase